MELFKSIGLFFIGTVKRVQWYLPTLLFDPFDIAERVFNVKYIIPQSVAWLLFGLGWFVAISLTYHDLRMKNAAYKEDSNSEKTIHSKLSNEARILLKRASFPDGTIMYGRTLGGTHIRVDRTNIIANPKNPREVAKWESALSELNKYKLISDPCNSGIFSVSHLGYKVADMIERK